VTPAAPTVTVISPTSGTTAGGTPVTIIGTNLNGATAVTFGGAAATGVSVVSPTQITAITPVHAVGTVPVVVTTPGGTATKSNAYTYVANAALVLGEIVVPNTPVLINTPIQVNASLTDPNSLDTFTAKWMWDDGTFSQPPIPLPAGTTKVSGSHTYTAPDVYKINLTVTANGGLSAYKEAQSYVVVYDPSAGYVIGAGAIDSPAGAYLPDTTLKGTGYFGFVSKYKQGVSKPQGATEFYYDLGTMNFFSNNYDWLVVLGSKASFKGSGTINGKGDYGFLLTATDGALLPKTAPDKSDKFRIRIWNKTPLKRVYDNMLDAPDDADPTTIIKSGFIIIQK